MKTINTCLKQASKTPLTDQKASLPNVNRKVYRKGIQSVNQELKSSEELLAKHSYILKNPEQQLKAYRKATKNLGLSMSHFQDVNIVGDTTPEIKQARKETQDSIHSWLKETVALLRQL